MRQLYSQVGLLVMLAVCGCAWRWGGRRERRAALLIAAAWIATLVVQRATGQIAPVGVLALMDLAVFLALLALSWRDRTGWVIYAVACQGVALGVHAIRLLSPAMSSWTYLTALAISSYGLLLALAWGVWGVLRERRRPVGSHS